jgi:small subunit ribosomal protein S15
MTLTKERKQELIDQFGDGPADTGRTEVQVALMTDRINDLTNHLRTNRKDHHSRRGLLMLVGRRRRLLNYLQRDDLERYRALIRELGLRR